MILALIARTRGWVAPALLGACVLVASVTISGVNAAVPMADGPRQVRHYLVGLAPSFAASILADHVSVISGNLANEARMRRIDVALYWIVAASAIPSALGAEWATQEGRYCLVMWLLLSSLGILLARTLGHEGVFALALLGIAWLVFGDTLAPILGFDLSAPPGIRPLPAIPVGAGAAVAIACSGIGSWLRPLRASSAEAS